MNERKDNWSQKCRYTFNVYIVPFGLSILGGWATYKLTTNGFWAVLVSTVLVLFLHIICNYLERFLDLGLSHKDEHVACRERFDRLLKSYALYTNSGNMEKVLDKIGEKPSPVKYAVARMISEMLSRVFLRENRATLADQDYGQFATAFNNCLCHCKKVILTCIFAPDTWFTKIKMDTQGRDDCWVDYDVGLKNLDDNELLKYTDLDSKLNRYPKHYVSHLGVEEPIRIFLLGEKEWDNLTTNKDAYQKFMRPCKKIKGMKTYFVKTVEFHKVFDDASKPPTQDTWLIQLKEKIHEIDINLFDNEACMRWRIDRKMEFIFGGEELTGYKTLVEFIQNRASQANSDALGIYTPETLEQKYGNLVV